MSGFFGGVASVDLASPTAIGNTTPNTGKFTTLEATTSLQVSTSGFVFGGTNLLEQRNSTNAQTFRLYNTFTDASNYERGFMRWATNVLEIGAEAAGTGTQRQLRFPLGTATTSTPLSITQTWNGAGVTFTGLQLNATDTASASGSLLMDLRIGASSVYSFGKGTFKIQAPSGIASTLAIYATSTNSNNGTNGPNCLDIFNSSGTRTACIRQDGLIASAFIGTVDDSSVTLVDSSGSAANYPSGVNVGSSSLVGWSSTSNWWGSKDIGLRRNSAGVLEVNNGASGTFRDLIVRNFRMSAPTGVPTANNSTGTEGSIRWDADYIYICTATNTWKRVAIATW